MSPPLRRRASASSARHLRAVGPVGHESALTEGGNDVLAGTTIALLPPRSAGVGLRRGQQTRSAASAAPSFSVEGSTRPPWVRPLLAQRQGGGRRALPRRPVRRYRGGPSRRTNTPSRTNLKENEPVSTVRLYV